MDTKCPVPLLVTGLGHPSPAVEHADSDASQLSLLRDSQSLEKTQLFQGLFLDFEMEVIY